MKRTNQRRMIGQLVFIVSGLAVLIFTFQNCSSGLSMEGATYSPSSGGSTPSDVAWVINPAPVFTIGSVTSFDLKPSFFAAKQSLQAGGKFAVDPTGAALPAGVYWQDQANGILAIDSSAMVGEVSGVIFAYCTVASECP